MTKLAWLVLLSSNFLNYRYLTPLPIQHFQHEVRATSILWRKHDVHHGNFTKSQINPRKCFISHFIVAKTNLQMSTSLQPVDPVVLLLLLLATILATWYQMKYSARHTLRLSSQHPLNGHVIRPKIQSFTFVYIRLLNFLNYLFKKIQYAVLHWLITYKYS